MPRLVGFTWESDGALHLTQRRSAIVRHPMTGAGCWFNDVGFFSQWSVDRFGDGEPISEQSWRSVLDGYDAVVRRVPWRTGDLLLIDNLLCAHRREPYTGDCELAIAPAETVPLANCSPTVAPQPG